MKQILDETIQATLMEQVVKLEDHFQADVLFYYGVIHPDLRDIFRNAIESLKEDEPKRNNLCIVLNTGGGSAETVEVFVNIIRHHYKEVYFIIPSYAYSAGTIFCMSGDKIFMDYYSSLGPIDPQIRNDKNKWLPALGYLDKVEEMLDKDREGKLTNAEFALLREQDIGMLRRYE